MFSIRKLTLFLSLPTIISALPVTLANATTADATQVMSDLSHIVNQVNANAAELSNTALLNANNNFTTVQSGINATGRTNFPVSGQVQDWAFNTLSSTLGTNTITGRVAGMTISAYADGQVFTFLPTQTNTGAVTLNVDGVNARGIMLGGTNVSAGVIRALIPLAVRYQDPVFHLLNDPSTAWTDYSAISTIVGWASFTMKVIRYKRIGTRIFVQFRLEGTSDATTSSFTMPNPTANISNAQWQWFAVSVDNGGTAAYGMSSMGVNSAQVDLWTSAAFGAWTGSGTKRCIGSFDYEAGN